LSKITVRQAKIEDLPIIAELICDTFASETYSIISELEPKASKQKFITNFLSRIQAGVTFKVFVAEKNGEIIGASGGAVASHHWSDMVWGSEDFWYVKKEHRKGRAGLMLFDELQNFFKEAGAQRIQMTHYTWNPKVAKFYEKKGFKPFEINYVYEVKDGSSDR